MRSARVSALLFGLCAFTALPALAIAAEAAAGSVAMLHQPGTPERTAVPLSRSEPVAEDQPAGLSEKPVAEQPAPASDIAVPALPDVTVTLPDAPLPSAESVAAEKPVAEHAAAASDIRTPALPEVEVTLPEAPQTAPSVALLRQPDTRERTEAPLPPAEPITADKPADKPEKRSAEQPANAPDIEVPPLPDVKVTLPEAPQTAPAAAALPPADVNATLDNLPLPPEAPVTFTATDRMIDAITVRAVDLETGKGLTVNARLPKDVRQAIVDYYKATDDRPIWIGNGTWTPAAQTVLAQLKRAPEDGLDAGDYKVPTLTADADQDALVQAELSLSAAAVLYARDARGGRINPGRLSKNITPQLELPKPANVLADLAGSRDAGHALAGYNPQHPGYIALKKKLAELRAADPSGSLPEVARGPVLKVGMEDARVPVLRQRLGITVAEGAPEVYDAALAAAVFHFQKSHRLKASGDLTEQTVAALDQNSNSPRRTEADLIANMERWRWLPTDMGERYVQVNVPEYELRFVADGSVIREARVIVGKAGSPTPIFSGSMQTVVVNPSWNIPPSILKNEILPGLARDPDYAAKRGYQVTQRHGRISVRQPPGARNALGFIKFLFPNQHAVYLHDTPNRNLFAANKRAFSHGCVRVDQPFQFAEVVLGHEWPQQKMRSLIGKGERNIKLEAPIPVHLTYFTMEIDHNGNLRRFDDIYGFNKQVRDALGLKG